MSLPAQRDRVISSGAAPGEFGCAVVFMQIDAVVEAGGGHGVILAAQRPAQHHADKQRLRFLHSHQIPDLRYWQAASLRKCDLHFQLPGDGGLVAGPAPADGKIGDVPAKAIAVLG